MVGDQVGGPLASFTVVECWVPLASTQTNGIESPGAWLAMTEESPVGDVTD
jgi:hypothetical protein